MSNTKNKSDFEEEVFFEIKKIKGEMNDKRVKFTWDHLKQFYNLD